MDYKTEYINNKAKYLELVSHLFHKQNGGKLTDKPVIILFNGYGSTSVRWQYKYIGENKLQKIDFLDKLQKIGDVYTFNLNFFNIKYYYLPPNDDKHNERKLFDKYKMYSSDIDFNLEDLDFKNICKNVYNNVNKKYGNKRKYIVLGHSSGADTALLFSKLYSDKILFCVTLDGMPRLLKYYETRGFDEFKKVYENINTNKKLHKILKTIRESIKKDTNVNKEIYTIFELMAYRNYVDLKKYYDNKLYVPTIFFRSYITDPEHEYQKNTNKYAVLEKEDLEKNNNSMHKYYVILNANHFMWIKQNDSDTIIDEIKYMLSKTL
jgi:hypothetical protein